MSWAYGKLDGIEQPANPLELFEVTAGLDNKRSRTVVAADFTVNLVAAVVLFACFVTGFFFTIVVWEENKSVEDNTNRVVRELVQDLHDSVPPILVTSLKASTQDMTAPDLSKEDKSVADTNAKLLNDVLLVSGIAAGAGVVFIIAVWAIMRMRAGWRTARSGIDYPDMRKLVVENLILLGWIAGAEITFLFFIAGRYRTLDGNVVRAEFIKTLRKFGNGK